MTGRMWVIGVLVALAVAFCLTALNREWARKWHANQLALLGIAVALFIGALSLGLVDQVARLISSGPSPPPRPLTVSPSDTGPSSGPSSSGKTQPSHHQLLLRKRDEDQLSPRAATNLDGDKPAIVEGSGSPPRQTRDTLTLKYPHSANASIVVSVIDCTNEAVDQLRECGCYYRPRDVLPFARKCLAKVGLEGTYQVESVPLGQKLSEWDKKIYSLPIGEDPNWSRAQRSDRCDWAKIAPTIERPELCPGHRGP